MTKTLLKKLLLIAGISFVVSNACAEDEMLKPFVLASKGGGSVAEKAEASKAALSEAGFTVVGEYSPYPDADVLVVTNNEMKSNAAQSEHGGFGVVQRVAITRVKDEVQVSYTNPVYMANAYRMKDDMKDVASALAKALGRIEEFGSKRGMSAAQARKYHYMIGMEYFDEPSLLAEYDNYDQAVKAVDEKLTSNGHGVIKVYRVDVPGKQETLFGTGLQGKKDGDKYMDDRFIMSEIDFHDVRSTAHLPYEVLVSGGKVYALYARFRIAINFPDLSMMGKNSFMNIMKTPDAIRDVLKKTVSKE
jgi:uncharacterized protein (DUF302 family)